MTEEKEERGERRERERALSFLFTVRTLTPKGERREKESFFHCSPKSKTSVLGRKK